MNVQAPLTTGAVPTCVPSIETVTVSPLTPVPAMTGSAVVVSVLPLAGLAMVGAAGAVGRATVKVSVAAVELGLPGSGLGRGDRVAGVAQGRGRREASRLLLRPPAAVPATCVPSIETVTVSPLTPVPAMAGSAVVVSVLPLAGLAMVGAAGAVGTATVKVSVAAVELGPPEAACVAVTVWLALLNGEVGVKLQAPLTTAAAPATCVPSIETVTVSPLTPVPAMTGSAVVVSVLPLAGLAMVGAAGAVGTATVKVSVAAVELGPPEAACVAVTVWLALLNGEVGVKLQAPLTTAAAPATVPSIETVTVSPLTPVPAMAGSAVVVSVLPLAGLVMVGAAGAVGTATVKVSVAAVELGPPEAACVAVTVWLALLRGEVGVKLQAPLTTAAAPATVPSIETVTVSPLTPVPAMAGSAVVVSVLPLAGLVMIGAAGAVGTATVKVSVAAVELGPPEAACVAVTVWLALLNGEVGVKLQAPLTTAAAPATVPSIETVTVSPLTPVPAMAGSAVVVSVLPLAGLVMIGLPGPSARRR